jgi:hypothetical protein
MKKIDSAKQVRIRIDQQTLDALKPITRPGVYEVGTLDDGNVIIRRIDAPTKPGAAERRAD